jgi:hypothetical protein
MRRPEAATAISSFRHSGRHGEAMLRMDATPDLIRGSETRNPAEESSKTQKFLLR